MRYQIKILMLFDGSQKSGKKITTYAVHTNDTHLKKINIPL
jgi:hypothetical protein